MSCLFSRRTVQSAALAFLFSACAHRGYQVASIQAATATAAAQPVTSAAPIDSAAEQVIRPFRQRVTSQMSVVVGQNAVALTKPGGQGNQAPLTRWVAHVLLTEAARAAVGSLQPAPELAALTNGSIRSGLPAGPLTVGHIYELMPFENELTVVPLAGSVVRQLCEYAVKFDNVAAVGLTWTKAPDGHAANILVNGAPLDEARTYQLAINDYLANGGDGMSFLRGLPQRAMNRTIRQAILDFLLREGTLTVP